jgi:hypothetical protein
MSPEQIQEDFPYLAEEDIQTGLSYAATVSARCWYPPHEIVVQQSALSPACDSPI